jgi:hypothetical protein
MANSDFDFKKLGRVSGRKGTRPDEARPRKGPSREEDEDRPRRRRDEEDDEDEEDRPRRKRRDDDDEARRPKRRPARDEDDEVEEEEDDDEPQLTATQRRWQKVHQGLLVNVIGAALLLASIGCLVLSVVLVILGSLLSWEGLADVAGILAFLGFICFIGKEIPSIVGYGFCLNAPNKKGTLPLAITSLVIGSVSMVAFIFFILLPLLDRGASEGVGTGGFVGGGVAGILFLLFSFSEWIVFPLYLKAVCQVLKDQYLDQAVNIPIALACGVIGSTVTLTFVTSVKLVRGEGGAKFIFAILFGLVLLIMLFFAISYLKAILAVRTRVASTLPKATEETE